MREDENDSPETAEADERRERPIYREDPLRNGPIRSWWNLLRSPRQQREDRPESGGNGGQPGLSGAVDRGVRLGYGVIDEQIRQGQRVAEELNSRSYGAQSMNRDLQEFVTRSTRYYMDMTSIFMDFMSNLPTAFGMPPQPFGGQAGYRPPAPGSTPGGPSYPWPATETPAPEGQSEAPAAPAAAARAQVDLRVVARRPVTVRLDLDPLGTDPILKLPSLQSADDDKAPITAITFEPASGEHYAAFSIEVPEDQPPGLYSGVVFEHERGEKCGTVSLRLE